MRTTSEAVTDDPAGPDAAAREAGSEGAQGPGNHRVQQLHEPAPLPAALRLPGRLIAMGHEKNDDGANDGSAGTTEPDNWDHSDDSHDDDD